LLDTQIFVRPERQERGIHASRLRARRRRVAAVTAAMALEALEDGFSGDLPEIAARDGRPAAAETGQVHQVETLAGAEPLKVSAGLGERRVLAQGEEAFQAEHRVVEVACAAAVRESAVGKMLAAGELANKAAGVTEEIRRQPGDLQHFESQT